MRAYNSATVVLKVVRLIFVDSKDTKEPRVSLLPLTLSSNKNGHSTLRGLVTVVPESCVRNSKDPRRALDRPHSHLDLIIANLSAELVKLLAVCPMVGAAEADANLEKL